MFCRFSEGGKFEIKFADCILKLNFKIEMLVVVRRYLFLGLIFFVSLVKAQDNTTALSDSIRTKADKVNADANQLKPKAEELQNLFDGYKARAKKCPKALKEADDGYNMAKKAVKDIDEALKITAKALKAKKPADGLKQVNAAEKKVHQAKYYVHESEDRKKETEFELRGCN